MLKQRLVRFLLYLCLVVFLAACLPSTPEEPYLPPWAYADLRALDKPDEILPAQDLIALYSRVVDHELQIRLDFLDLTSDLESDVILALDYEPGGKNSLFSYGYSGSAWDTRIVISASGPIRVLKANGEEITRIKLRVLCDPVQDTLLVFIDQDLLIRHGYALKAGNIKVHAFTVQAEQQATYDQIGPGLGGIQPPGKAQVLIAFWNTMPAATPAQALRSWNGAHSGPQNTRHGLRSVIDAVQSTSVPVFLLDLKTPASLSSLEYLGGLRRVRELAGQGLLIIPESIPLQTGLPGQSSLPPAWVFRRVAMSSQKAITRFGMSGSPFLYIPGYLRADINGYAKSGMVFEDFLSGQERMIFLHSGTNHPGSSIDNKDGLFSPQSSERWRQTGILWLPWLGKEPGSQPAPNLDPQATEEGPSLELRRALVSLAVQSEATTRDPGQPFLLLGGDLARSNWGHPQAVSSTLRYMADHPWIKVLDANALLSASPRTIPAKDLTEREQADQLSPFIPGSPQGQPIPSGLNTAQIEEQLLPALQASPPGVVTELAWQAYTSLYAPAIPDLPALHHLRAAYLGQIGHLLAAAQWAEHGPGMICNTTPGGLPCLADVDWDGQEEVILETGELFTVFEPDGGILTFAFTRIQGKVHQLIGPSSQFTVGLSDPTVWKQELGPAGDPGQFPGAFADFIQGYNEPIREASRIDLSTGSVTFFMQDSAIMKTISLVPTGLRIDYQTGQSLKVQVPLVIDPWLRFQQGWGDLYQEKPAPPGWGWGFAGGSTAQIQTSGELSTQAFTASRMEIRIPEDPNYSYPAGHYLPYPMAIAAINGEGYFFIQILLSP